ncbi:protein of unknown function [Burkholderia multivorans]
MRQDKSAGHFRHHRSHPAIPTFTMCVAREGRAVGRQSNNSEKRQLWFSIYSENEFMTICFHWFGMLTPIPNPACGPHATHNVQELL